MWFVFPQLRGLGTSEMAWRYGIASGEEARAYLAHPLLGARLREAVAAVQAAQPASAQAMFGAVDAMKLASSLTLFDAVAPAEPLFAAVLDALFAGARDAGTLTRLARRAPPTR